jgi:hypothetical protein
MKKAWPDLLQLVGPERLPSGPGAEEFGCGHYGCVWPTASGQVVKITSDTTEASFVAANLSMGGVTGMVAYHQIVKLRGTHRRRPIFVIWRDEAWDVGQILLPSWKYGKEDQYDRRSAVEAVMFLDSFKMHAAAARDYLKSRQRRRGDAAEIAEQAWEIHGQQPHWNRGSWATELQQPRQQFSGSPRRFNMRAVYGLRAVDKVAAHLAACAHLAVEMQTSVRFVTNVGQALGDCLEEGILLADVHAQNVGKIKVEPGSDYLDWGITDPGHAVFLASRWDSLTVPELVTRNPRRRR